MSDPRGNVETRSKKARKTFLLRLDPALYQQVEEWAQQDLRSVNGQIEYVLKQAVERRTGRSLPSVDDGENCK